VRTRHLALALFLLCGTPAHADVTSDRADATALTIYAVGGGTTHRLEDAHEIEWARRDGLALVTETRTVDLPAGPSQLRLRNVVSTMVPQTADIKGLPPGAVERNFDYDLLSPGSLLAKSVGTIVHLVRTDPKTGKQTQQDAVVRSAGDGALLETDGKLEALRCSGLAERLVFDKVPDGLTDTPTLSVQTNLPAAGRYTITLSYLATGLGWSSNYVAHVRTDGRTLDLSGWITLANFTATSFEHVPVQFVAGTLNMTGNDEPVSVEPLTIANNCWLAPKPAHAQPNQEFKYEDTADRGGQVETVVVTGSRIPDPRVLGDYKLYALPEPATVAAMQVKQVQFLDQRGVPFERVYGYVADSTSTNNPLDSDSAGVSIRLQNRADAGLGKPLPAGNVAVSEVSPEGDPILLGEGQMGNVAVGLPIEFGLGKAMGVYAERRVIASHKVANGDTVNSFEVDIENQKPFPIAFELLHPSGGTGFRIVSEDRPHRIVPYGVCWDFQLQPGERARMHFVANEGQY
jgi:hypothetical protein